MKRAAILLALLCLAAPARANEAISARVEALLGRMTIEEKAGQLNLETADWSQARDLYLSDAAEARLRAGRIGGFFNMHERALARRIQEIAVHGSRLGIPVLLGYDVVHGYRTIFPMPLAQAASFDLARIERSERIAASEAIGDGVNITFSPMLDTSRDPRWGRTAESAGESPWWSAQVAVARLRGFQGERLAATDSLAACPKHLGANGATRAGLDYTGAEIGERELREVHLPPFRAVVATAPCFMAAFNTYDQVPAAASPFLLRRILRDEWRSGAVVMSDFGALLELERHGVASDDAMAARLAIAGGLQLDMASAVYRDQLPALVRAGRVPEAAVDEAVRHVLRLKEQMGLLDDPFARFTASEGMASPEALGHREEALAFAERSLVLLQNRGDRLPLRTDVRRVAVIGPHADAPQEMLGSWVGRGAYSRPVSLAAGLRQVLDPGAEVVAVPVGDFAGATPAEQADALAAARAADSVVLALGEPASMSGEASSRTEIDLPGAQNDLAEAVLAVGRPTVAVLFAGRPLAIERLSQRADAILLAWFPGTMGGTAVARMLFGLAEPVGRMPMTTPRAVGQIPLHHERLPSGRPAVKWPDVYSANYVDRPTTPLYPFGHGLAYTRFAFQPPVLDRTTIGNGETVNVSVTVRNVGPRAGTAMVQLYLRNRVAPISRPVQMFRDFERVTLAPEETATVTFQVKAEDFAYWQAGDRFAAPAGPIDVMTGPSAGEVQTVRLEYAP
ncbi:beta-glucosidase [Stella humosa]|uniref:beta-glucosidase n=1 Tax=Stella humosa TaxID=94 RepID=A0A3N1KR67_9PROT|nr:glycoside hydrolase family 3 N-terminal domain-containing protein [Stella humosa]ROP84333.1 beta-glucosidase [Stella humosa]BBK33847.1 beta-glucosidase [Stella humosa]